MTGPVNECYNGAMNKHEERFHKLMAILAARCKTELDELEIEIYDRNLSKHGYEAICGALETILVERSSHDPFPPIGLILSRLGIQTTPRNLAIDTTNKIVTAIRTKGYNWADKVPNLDEDMRRHLGEVGLMVVKRLGGWMAVIELANGNPNHYRTWIRDSAVAVIESGGPKLLALPQAAPQLQVESKAK